MKTTFVFDSYIDLTKWSEILLELLCMAVLFDETVKYTIEVSSGAVTKIEVDAGLKTSKMVNVEQYLTEMGGRKVASTVIFPL